ncbi:phosphatase PAP2 family protein [Variovorax sp. OV329]|uniref:phosphatase PAP2 family protein n=1 Tax=Variovorax sp. OV329 TaxID=1882825 RepID=UPI001587A567|nr:phosphatase PAP2 family protein [Variovorax sp. OV329]
MQAIHLAIFEALRAEQVFTQALLWLARHGATLGAALVAWVIVRHPQERIHACAVVLAALLASAIAHALADSLGFVRPYMAGLGTPRIPHGARGGLPSAHASVMFTVALLLWRRPNLRLTALAATLLAVLTSWGRIHANVHFPIDIAAGLLLAVVLATAVHLLPRGLSHLSRRTARSPVQALALDDAAPTIRAG